MGDGTEQDRMAAPLPKAADPHNWNMLAEWLAHALNDLEQAMVFAVRVDKETGADESKGALEAVRAVAWLKSDCMKIARDLRLPVSETVMWEVRR